jgi:hypothetical protein
VYFHCRARVDEGTESRVWDVVSAGMEMRDRAAMLPVDVRIGVWMGKRRGSTREPGCAEEACGLSDAEGYWSVGHNVAVLLAGMMPE